MDAHAPDEQESPALVNRRQLLRLTGGVGLIAMGGACSRDPDANYAALQPTSPSAHPSANTTSANPTGASVTRMPPPAPLVPGPATPANSAALMLCRDAWGARPARPGGKAHSVNRMTIHHSGAVLGDNSNAPGRFRQDQQYHQDQLGWVDIAYHIGIDRNGNIYQLRDPAIAGDTATDYDTSGHFLVLCEGDFDQESVTEELLRAISFVCSWAAHTFQIATSTLAGHRDLAQTACPGANLYAHISSGDLKRRIDQLLAAGGVNLHYSCGRDATDKVKAIESGN